MIMAGVIMTERKRMLDNVTDEWIRKQASQALEYILEDEMAPNKDGDCEGMVIARAIVSNPQFIGFMSAAREELALPPPPINILDGRLANIICHSILIGMRMMEGGDRDVH